MQNSCGLAGHARGEQRNQAVGDAEQSVQRNDQKAAIQEPGYEAGGAKARGSATCEGRRTALRRDGNSRERARPQRPHA